MTDARITIGRDFDVMRELLLEVRHLPLGGIVFVPRAQWHGKVLLEMYEPAVEPVGDPTDEDYQDELRFRNAELLYEGGFVTGGEREKFNQRRTWHDSLQLSQLTWAGEDLLDSILDETVWNETQNLLSKVSGTVSLEILKATAGVVAKGMLGI